MKSRLLKADASGFQPEFRKLNGQIGSALTLLNSGQVQGYILHVAFRTSLLKLEHSGIVVCLVYRTYTMADFEKIAEESQRRMWGMSGSVPAGLVEVRDISW